MGVEHWTNLGSGFSGAAAVMDPGSAEKPAVSAASDDNSVDLKAIDSGVVGSRGVIMEAASGRPREKKKRMQAFFCFQQAALKSYQPILILPFLLSGNTPSFVRPP